MAAGDHTLTVFVEIYSADAYRGCHVERSRNRVEVLVVRFAYLLSLSGPLQQYLSVGCSAMAGKGEQEQGSLQRLKRPLWVGEWGHGQERRLVGKAKRGFTTLP